MGNQKEGFFTVKDSVYYTGAHLFIELWSAKGLGSLKKVKNAFVSAVKAIKASLLEIRLHLFSPNRGISGVAILSESHISIHVWPEFNYAAVDIFAPKNTELKSVDFLSEVSKYKQFYSDAKQYSPKIHYC